MASPGADLTRLRRVVEREFPDLKPRTEAEQEARAKRPPALVDLHRAALRPELFGYQKELCSEIVVVVGKRGRGLLALPTGGGKTRTAVAAVLDCMATGVATKVVWLAPSIELVDQALATFVAMWKEHGRAPDVSLVRSEDRARGIESVILLTTPQAIHSRSRRGRSATTGWDLIVFDEAHQLGARTFREAVNALMTDQVDTPLIGLSATPGRVDPDETESLVQLFGGALLTSKQLRPNPVETLQRRGVLARLQFRRVVEVGAGLMSEAERLVKAVRLAADLAMQNRRVLVFTASVAGAQVFAEATRSVGVAASAVHSGMSEAARSEAIESFGRGDLRVLSNQKLLATGYDCPAISDLILVGRIGSPILFEQIVGRAARGTRTGGYAVATVWDFDDHLTIHGLPQSYYRFRDFDWE